jgi:hypothetical protein
MTGRILRTIRGDAAGFEDPTGGSRSLGMLSGALTYSVNRIFIDKQPGRPTIFPDMTAVRFFTGDSNGNVLVCDVKDKPVSDWKLRSVFQLLSSAGAPISIPLELTYAAAPCKDGSCAWGADHLTKVLGPADPTGYHEWLYGGTADLMVPHQNHVRKMENPEQYVWAQDLTVCTGRETTSDLFPLRYIYDEVPIGGINHGDCGPEGFVSPDLGTGWYLKLRPAYSDVTAAEYVTTPPYIFNDELFFTTFIPKPVPADTADKQLCLEPGDAKIYRMDPVTGRGLWPGGRQAFTLENMKVSGIAEHGDMLLFAVKKVDLSGGALPEDSIWVSDSLLAVRVVRRRTPPLPPVNTNIPHIEYWKEHYR